MQSVIAGLGDLFDRRTFESIEESPVSHVTRAYYSGDADRKWPAAIKTASYLTEHSKQPHDIVKEFRILAILSHENIINILNGTYDQDQALIHFWMPFIPYSLHDLLESSAFTPHRDPYSLRPSQPLNHEFALLSRSLIYQLASALQYLHDDCAIAHRDIKPRNILLTESGTIKLIDFGIAWDKTFSPTEDVLWPEPLGALCSHVCSGPYRAPETIFSATNYDPYAVDLWSFGSTCAEFFTPLRFVVEDEDEPSFDEEDGSQSDIEQPAVPFINLAEAASQRGTWSRDSLFDAEKGSIGLAWSIFKIRGTPTDVSWPSFQDLPDATKLTFFDAKPANLARYLPNLPDSLELDFAGLTVEDGISHFPPSEPTDSAIDFVHKFLVYPPDRRMKAREALNHPWLKAHSILLPRDYIFADSNSAQQKHAFFLKGRSLAAMMLSFLSPESSSTPE